MSSLRVAIQKSGRLSEASVKLFRQLGLDFQWSKDRLFCQCTSDPIEFMFVRDDDIPEYVIDGICQLGIVGLNVLEEHALNFDKGKYTVLRELGFGQCRLSVAVPKDMGYEGPQSLSKLRIATTYPNLLERFLEKNNILSRIVKLSGAVEIAPTVDVADAVCDLVSTGTTLKSNGLKEVEQIFFSQSVLVKTASKLNTEQETTVGRLLDRLDAVYAARGKKYIMMNAPVSSVPKIKTIIPGLEEPSILNITGTEERVAIHAVSNEDNFWETVESLKAVGASSILVLGVEKLIS